MQREMIMQAVHLHEQGYLDEAIALYQRILKKNNKDDQIHFLMGNALLQKQQWEHGIESIKKSLKIYPANPIALNNLGNAFKEIGQFQNALKSFDKAIVYDSGRPEFYTNRGNVLHELGRFEEALSNHDRCISLNPNIAESHNGRGNALKELGRFADALDSYGKALSLTPDYAEAHNNRGVILQELKRYDEALASHDKAISLSPEYAEAYNNRGNALQELKRYNEAFASHNRAIALKPDYAEAYYSRGVLLQELGRYDEALVSYDEALVLKPDYADANWNKALVLILKGQYAEGWMLYEWRFKIKENSEGYYKFPQLSWRGQESIQSRKLLIYAEQGLGDVIQFCRYLPQARKLCAEIIFEVPHALIPLISTLGCDMTVVAKGNELPEFDAYCPLMSLPYVFKTTVETIPVEVPYLRADKTKVAEWLDRLGHKDKMRVGLAWSGSTSHKGDKKRSMKLEWLRSLTNLPIDFHSLQKEYRDQDLEHLNNLGIHQHQDDLNDFSDTAALIECMDLVISVDTSVAHVAGAIGKAVWIMLPSAPDYRWMLERTDSPWYPTAKLFRQKNIGDWQSVIQSMSNDLGALVKQVDLES